MIEFAQRRLSGGDQATGGVHLEKDYRINCRAKIVSAVKPNNFLQDEFESIALLSSRSK
jgi:hypothetical protein